MDDFGEVLPRHRMKAVVLSSPGHCTEILSNSERTERLGWMEDGEHMEEKEMQQELGLFSLKRGRERRGFFAVFSFLVGGFREVEPGFSCNLFLYSWFQSHFLLFFWKPANKQTNKQKALSPYVSFFHKLYKPLLYQNPLS